MPVFSTYSCIIRVIITIISMFKKKIFLEFFLWQANTKHWIYNQECVYRTPG